MTSCLLPRMRSLLLAGSTLAVVAGWSAVTLAAPADTSFVVAQADAQQKKGKPAAKKPEAKKPEAKPAPRPQQPAARHAPPAAQPQQRRAAPARPEPRREQPPARTAQPPQPKAPAGAPQRAQAPATAQKPPQSTQQEQHQDRRERRDDRRPQGQPAPGTPRPPAAQQQPSIQRAPAAQQQAPSTQPRTPAPQQAPATQQQPPAAGTATQKPAPQPPAATQQGQTPSTQPRTPTTQQAPATQQQAPAARAAPAAQPAPAAAAAPAVAPPARPSDASQFIRRRNAQAPAPNLNQVKQQRQEVREGNRTIIREDNRVIVRDGNRIFVHHNDANRFAVGARNVHTERRGGNTETIVERGNGVRIVNVTDGQGRLLRRVRRDNRGRDVVIIDNSRAFRNGFAAGLFLSLAEPVIRIPRERYILDAYRARPADIYGVLMEPPVEVIDEPYTLDQVRYNAPLRDRMPRVDLDINFDSGSWQLTEEEIDKLGVIADAVNRALQSNPAEVFMVEGYTDATGNEVDNLSLSDRRAEAVAVALTEQFQVPAENLVTQGYGEQYLKVPTQGPERANRRVAVRRITPLLNAQAGAPPPR